MAFRFDTSQYIKNRDAICKCTKRWAKETNLLITFNRSFFDLHIFWVFPPDSYCLFLRNLKVKHICKQEVDFLGSSDFLLKCTGIYQLNICGKTDENSDFKFQANLKKQESFNEASYSMTFSGRDDIYQLLKALKKDGSIPITCKKPLPDDQTFLHFKYLPKIDYKVIVKDLIATVKMSKNSLDKSENYKLLLRGTTDQGNDFMAKAKLDAKRAVFAIKLNAIDDIANCCSALNERIGNLWKIKKKSTDHFWKRTKKLNVLSIGLKSLRAKNTYIDPLAKYSVIIERPDREGDSKSEMESPDLFESEVKTHKLVLEDKGGKKDTKTIVGLA